jgi:hypothetical protein
MAAFFGKNYTIVVSTVMTLVTKDTLEILSRYLFFRFALYAEWFPPDWDLWFLLISDVQLLERLPHCK